MTEILRDLIPIVVAIAGGATIPELFKWARGRIKSRDKELREAWSQRDAEAKLRREYEKVLHSTRLEWHLESDKPYKDMPKDPDIS